MLPVNLVSQETKGSTTRIVNFCSFGSAAGIFRPLRTGSKASSVRSQSRNKSDDAAAFAHELAEDSSRCESELNASLFVSANTIALNRLRFAFAERTRIVRHFRFNM